ncbi:hydroxyacid dehydrogenase [Minwuia sp.]|uniref:hydroxyacid dehydrogenase n=1 Tax=Minwuia sp. TaxID=2493630 RepID=UPI003A942FA5
MTSDLKRILMVEPMDDVGPALLKERGGFDVIAAPDTRPETLVAMAEDIQAIAVRTAPMPAAVLAAFGDLEIVSRHGVGCDNLDVPHLTGRAIPIAIALNANAVSVAEHAMMLMLALARKLRAQDRAVRAGRFSERNTMIAGDLHGATVLVVGFGGTGSLVAARCRAFGMTVVICSPSFGEQQADASGYECATDLQEALARADFVSLHLPLNRETRHLFSDRLFDAMKPGAVLVNCARGGIVDEAALIRALDRGQLSAAGIDVFAEEPPSADHPLFTRDDVLLTPHNGTASHGAMREMSRMTFQNILDFFDGCLQPRHTFNPEAIRTSR